MGIINYIKELENIWRDSTSSSNDNTSSYHRQSNVRNKDPKDQVGLLKPIV